MLHRTVSRRFLWLRLLRGSLVAGALYDLAFAGLMVAAPDLPAGWLSLPLPGEAFYLGLFAVLLAMLAVLYIAAARDPRRYSAIIFVAITGRAAGGLVLALAAWRRPDLAGLWPLAAADLGFAALHAVSWLPLRA
jgi:hypothetical protein